MVLSTELGNSKIGNYAAVLMFFEFGAMPPGVNDMTIVFIPKVPHAADLKDSRPISLCNVVNKVVQNVWSIVFDPFSWN